MDETSAVLCGFVCLTKSIDPLTNILRNGAAAIAGAAVEMEAEAFLADDEGSQAA